jgi:hypothetical protein
MITCRVSGESCRLSAEKKQEPRNMKYSNMMYFHILPKLMNYGYINPACVPSASMSNCKRICLGFIKDEVNTAFTLLFSFLVSANYYSARAVYSKYQMQFKF